MTYPLHHGADCGTSKPGNNEPWPPLKMLKNGLKNGSCGRLNTSPSLALGLESPIVPETRSKSINHTQNRWFLKRLEFFELCLYPIKT